MLRKHMGFLRHIIGLFVALLLSALSAVAMPMASTASHHAEFFPQHEGAKAKRTNVRFAARAPPMAAADVSLTGAAVVFMLGHETLVAGLGFGVGLDATNSRPIHLTSHPNAHIIARHGP